MKIKIFSTTTCPYCKMLKKFLDEKSIKYEEGMVDQDEAELAAMQKVADGHQGVPFTVITKDDGSEVKIVGFDQKKFEEVLGL